MFERFRKGKPQPEVSPGGSVIHRYDAATWSATPVGLPEESAAAFAQAREDVYRRFFGEALSVSHEVVPLVPHIDVFTFRRTGEGGRKVITLATSGMSNLPMRVPANVDAPRRVELIFYCAEPLEPYIRTLRWLAHFPHDQHTWIGAGHTVPNGNPPEPFWGSSVLDTILFAPPIVQRDRKLPEELNLDGDPVEFLWVVPLTSAECQLKLDKGVGAVFELFERHRHPYIFDPGRSGYV